MALAVPARALVALELAALELAVRALVALELARAAAVPARGQALVLAVLEPAVLEPAVLVAGQALELLVRAAAELAPGVVAWLADSRPRCTRSMPSHAARRRFIQPTRLRKSRRCGRPRVSRIRTGSAATTWSRQ